MLASKPDLASVPSPSMQPQVSELSPDRVVDQVMVGKDVEVVHLMTVS